MTLHIYDVDTSLGMQALNRVLSLWGTGAFHAGVEIHGKEWSYGTPVGVHSCPPRCAEDHAYHESVLMGHTRMREAEVGELIGELKRKWHGAEYDVLAHNCCHFAEEIVRQTVGVQVPTRIMTLAGAGASIVTGAEYVAEQFSCGQDTQRREYVRTVCASVQSPHSESQSAGSSVSGSRSSTKGSISDVASIGSLSSI